MNNLAIAATLCVIAVYSISGVAAQGGLMCYNCTYVSVAGIELGVNCNDPFDATGVAEITCDGSCVIRTYGGDIVSTQRTCNTQAEGQCVNLDNYSVGPDSTISQKCCTANLCNGGGGSGAGIAESSLVLALAALCGAIAGKY